MKSARNRGRKKARFSAGTMRLDFYLLRVCTYIYVRLCVCALVAAITDDQALEGGIEIHRTIKTIKAERRMKERNRSCSDDPLPRAEDTKTRRGKKKNRDERSSSREEEEKEVAIEREAGRRG